MKFRSKFFLRACVACFTIALAVRCNAFGTDSSDDQTLLALGLAAAASSASACYGNQTSLAASLPAWITSNFSCVTAYTQTEGGVEYYVFETDSVPPHRSPYWGTSSAYWESMPAGGNQDISQFVSQSYKFKIPVNPVAAGAPVAAPGIAAGIAKNGVVFFFGQASPGNSLSAELDTFDGAQGHPDGGFKRYHYHAEPKYIANYETAFLGLMIDGYPIYGPREADGTAPSTTGATGGGLYPQLEADTYGHTHATAEFPGGVFHYHITNWDNTVNIPSLPVFLHGTFSIGNVTF